MYQGTALAVPKSVYKEKWCATERCEGARLKKSWKTSIAALRSGRRSSRRNRRRLRVRILYPLHYHQLGAAFASAGHVNELPVGVEGQRMSLDLGLELVFRVVSAGIGANHVDRAILRGGEDRTRIFVIPKRVGAGGTGHAGDF